MTFRTISMAGVLFLAAVQLLAQTAPTAFEVASVKPSNPEGHSSSFSFNGGAGLSIEGGTLRKILETAYDVRTFQILGGPGWVDSDRYDISAKNAPDDPVMKIADVQERVKVARLKLQTLLAERFQLKVHRETKDLPEYALVVAKGGSKMKEIANLPQAGISSNCGLMTGTRTTMTNMTVVLSRQLGRPVLDRTGLPGIYDFKMTYTPDTGACSQPADGRTAEGANPGDGPSIFTALQEQLGLKLESIKGPVEIIVIDHAEKADAN
jgi:uncharacterized protein (TIGR03435 family)